MSRHGVQPARAFLQARRFTTRQAADAIRVDLTHLASAIGGHVRPCQAVRDRLPNLLGVPLQDLFSEEALRLPYAGDLGLNFGPQRKRPVSS